MFRPARTRALALAAVVAATLSACSTFDDADTVAEVAGTTIDNDHLNTYLTEYTDRSDLFQTTPIEAGRAAGNEARVLLGALIQQELFRTFADEYGIDLDPIRQSFIDTSLAASPVADTSVEFQELIADVETQVQAQAVSEVAVPNIDRLRELYAAQPASTGALCMRHILVQTEEDADEVLGELRAGADFAELAVERSIDPTAADLGGAISDGSSECVQLQTVLSGFDQGFAAGALTSAEGVPSEPTESAFGWHIILHRPWDEIAASMGDLHQPGRSGSLLFDGHRITADVQVAPRLGSWDPLVGGVLPVG